MWTKIRSLPGSDGTLADNIYIPPRSPIPPTNIGKVRARQKSMETQKPFIKNGDVGMTKYFSKKDGNKG